MVIEEDQVKCTLRVQDAQRLLSTTGNRGLHAPIIENSAKDKLVGPIVIDHQHAQAAQFILLFDSGYGLIQRFVGMAKANDKVKRAAHTGLAFHPNASPHHFHQFFRNGQAQARSAEVAGGGSVCLSERLKDQNLF